MNKKHIFFYRLFHPLVVLFLKIRFGYKFEKAKNLPENYMVISNHVTDYDPILVAASFKRQMYFVGSEHIARWKLAYKFLSYAFDPIMRSKGASASSAIMELMKRAKKGSNVCLFAEGVRSWDGVTCPILPSTAKLIQGIGCGLVTYKLTGGYFTSPMWSGASVRKGYLHGAPVHVFTKEQLKAMTTEDIYKIIVDDLYEDAYERQRSTPIKYRGKHLAERLENLLFVCHKCGKKDTYISKDDTVSCKECGSSFRYNEYGMLEDAPFETLKEFSDWQKGVVAKDVLNQEIYTAESAKLSTIKKHETTFVGEGPLMLSVDSLKCGDTEVELKDIVDMAMYGQRAIVFTANGNYYELIPAEGYNVYKFLLFYDEYKKNRKEQVR